MSAASCRVRMPARQLRTAAIFAGVALGLGLWLSSEAIAQCNNDFNFGVASVGPGGVRNLNPTTSPLISIINTVNTAFLTNTTSFVSAPAGANSDQQSGGVWGRVVGGVVDFESQNHRQA